MYNKNVKDMFFEEIKDRYAEGTIRIFETTLNKAAETEEILGKDIYEMNFEECKQLLKGYTNRSVDMFNGNRSRLETYKAWCVKEGYDPTLMNFFSMISVTDSDDYIDHLSINNRVISYEELLGFENEIENYQDFVYAVLPFIGVYGKTAQEMIDLEVKDVYETHIELLNRQIPIDDKVYNILINAIEEKDYRLGNGLSTRTNDTERVINPTEWVLRTVGSKKYDKVNYPLVQSKMQRLQKYLGNNINITNLMLSGKVHFAKEILEEKGELTNKDWININKRFGYSDKGSVQYASVTKNRVMKYLDMNN